MSENITDPFAAFSLFNVFGIVALFTAERRGKNSTDTMALLFHSKTTKRKHDAGSRGVQRWSGTSAALFNHRRCIHPVAESFRVFVRPRDGLFYTRIPSPYIKRRGIYAHWTWAILYRCWLNFYALFIRVVVNVRNSTSPGFYGWSKIVTPYGAWDGRKYRRFLNR